MDKFRRVLTANKRKLLSKDNVVGVGIGKKMIRGEKTDETSIVVFVKKKLDKGDLSANSIVPYKVGDVKTDVIEIGEVRALASLRERVRPAYPGVSVGHYAITAGTLGAVVRSRKNRDILILSNNHVLANVTNGKDDRAKIGDPILQPGPVDGGTKENDVIAHLENFVPLVISLETPECNVANTAVRAANAVIKMIRPNYSLRVERASNSENIVDAAVAKVINRSMVRSEIPEIGRITGVNEVQLGEKVKKVGRTTGLTEGTIETVDVSIVVNMSEEIQAVFDQQVVSNVPSLPGDSGSLIVNENNEAVGLLFAGSDTSTIFNPIKPVLEKLDIEFF